MCHFTRFFHSHLAIWSRRHRRPRAPDRRGGGFCSCNEAPASVAHSLNKSNFAPAMMHDARRIADVDRVRQRTAISCLARFSRVDEAAFSFSLPLCILGWKPPPRAQFGRLPLYSSLCSMDENVIASTANGVGGTD